MKILAYFGFSQSSLQDYSNCPPHFQLHYLDRMAYPAAESEPALENEHVRREVRTSTCWYTVLGRHSVRKGAMCLTEKIEGDARFKNLTGPLFAAHFLIFKINNTTLYSTIEV